MEINQTPFILKKLRKTCRISQIHLALTLDMDQASISRLEKGTQGITLDILVKLAKFYDLKVEQLISGKINYYALAQSFGQVPKIPSKYRTNENIHFRECYPILRLIRKFGGDSSLQQILGPLGLEDLVYMEPHHLINTLMLVDIFISAKSKKIISKRDIPFLANESLSPECLGSFYDVFIKQESPLDLMTSWVLNSPSFDAQNSFKLIKRKEDSISMNWQSSTTQFNQVIIEKNLETFFINMKEMYFKKLFGLFQKTSAQITIVDSPFQGGATINIGFSL